jgi:hypothetical protein
MLAVTLKEKTADDLQLRGGKHKRKAHKTALVSLF